MSGNTKRSGQDWKSSDLRNELIKEAISKIDLRSAMEFYGVSFNQKGAALCPFHKEKTASFLLKNGNKGPFWHCFGCGESGSVFTFVQKHEGLEFIDAVKKLAQQCGVEIKEKEDPEAGKRARLYALHAELAAFFRRCLLRFVVLRVVAEFFYNVIQTKFLEFLFIHAYPSLESL